MVKNPVPDHPVEYSPEILEMFATLITAGEHVHDCFAGRGRRLGALCDRLGATFTGTDCEHYPNADPRVRFGSARWPESYPPAPFSLFCSPVYLNGISSDYKEGPTAATNLEGRRAYGISLGHALHAENLARTVVRSRPDKGASDYYPGHADVVKHWDHRAVVNVDEPMGAAWCELLEAFGYRIAAVIPVHTQRYRGLDNADVRAEHEIVIVAERN